MRRTFASMVVFGVLLALSFAGYTARSLAEPISGGDAAANPAAPSTAAQPQELTDAVARFKENNLAGALKLLREAAKKYPDLPPAELMMVQLCAQANGLAEARAYLEQAIVEHPTDPEAYIVIAEQALRERRLLEAELVFQKAQSIIASFDKSAKRKGLLEPRIYKGLATMARARNNWAGVQSNLEAWLKLEPKNSEALQGLAMCLFQQKNPQGALERLREAAKVDPQLLTPELVLARFYEASGDHENAKKWMAEGIKAAPKVFKTRMAAAEYGLSTGQIDYAAEQVQAAMQIDPKSLDAMIMAGVVALFQKDYPKAEQYFQQATLQSPDNFAASNNLALALAEQNDEAKRKRALERADNNFKQRPKDSEAASTYGCVLYKMGRLDQAEEAFKAAVNSGRVSPDTAYYIARLNSDRGQDERARTWLTSALKQNGPFLMRQEAEALLKRLKK